MPYLLVEREELVTDIDIEFHERCLAENVEADQTGVNESPNAINELRPLRLNDRRPGTECFKHCDL
jgi:hypothetical protein